VTTRIRMAFGGEMMTTTKQKKMMMIMMGWMDGRTMLGSNLCSEPPFGLRDRIVLPQGFLSKERVLFASPAHGTHRPGMG
jgi:hypothetical protein